MHGANDAVICSRTLPGVQRISGNGYIGAVVIVFIIRRFRLFAAFSGRAAPAGIQSAVFGVCIQYCNFFAANKLRVPTFKFVAFICRFRNDLSRQISVIALHIGISRTAVEIVKYIGIVGRRCLRVLAIEIHVGFAQAASEQIIADLTAGIAPAGKTVDKLIAGCTVNNGLAQVIVAIDPSGAAVVGKQQQCIKLILIQRQLISFDQVLIDVRLKSAQKILKQRLCFLLGDAILQIIINLVRGASGTVTHSVLGIIPDRVTAKTFLRL